MSCAHGTRSHTIVQRSLETVSSTVLGETPRRSTPRPPTSRLPIQCMQAPVW